MVETARPLRTRSQKGAALSVPNAPTEERPAAVYRLWDAQGNLLYVGSAYDPEGRCQQHREKPWWPEVTRRTEEWHTNRTVAYVHEYAVIAAEGPRYNQLGTAAYEPAVTDARLRQAEAARGRGAAQARAAALGREMRDFLAVAGADVRVQSGARRLLELAYLEGSGLFPQYVETRRAMLAGTYVKQPSPE